MSERPEHHVVYFNDLSYPVRGEQYNQLATFPAKVTQGDFTRDSDNLMSSKIWTDFTGGIGVRQIREGSDDGSYYFGTLDASKPYQLALPRLTELLASGPTYPLGDLGNEFLAADNDTLYQWDEEGGTWSSVGSLDDVPQNKGIEFNGKLYIPQGAAGFQTWDGVDVGTQVTSVKAVSFTEWNNQIWAVCTDGTLQSSLDGSSWNIHFTLNESHTPRQIVSWLDTSGDDALYISTNNGIIAWDHYAGEMIATRLRFPKHPHNGYGVGTWRIGEDLFISAGLQVYRFTLSAISEMGPNKPNGLPAEFRGYIKDFEPEHNALYALVQGEALESEDTDEIAFDPSMTEEAEFTSQPTRALSLLLKWVETGWHVAWASTKATTPYWSVVSTANNTYRIFWGTSDGVWSSVLPTTLSNPRELIEAGEGRFNASGYLETGQYDAGMRRFEKLASHVELTFSEFPDVCQAVLKYRINDGNWQVMPVNGPWEVGTKVFPFGVETLSDGTIFSRGVVFDRIEFRLEFSTTDPRYSPVMDSMVLKFIKRPLNTDNYSVDIILDNEWRGRSAFQLKDELDTLITSGEFIWFRHGSSTHNSHRVYLGNIQGINQSGDDPRGYRTVSIIEIPVTGGGYDGTTTS